MDVAVSDEGTLVFKAPGTLANSASNWIVLGAKALTLEPGKARDVECKIRAPGTPGEFYSAIMVTLDTRGGDPKGLSIVRRIASGVCETVPGRPSIKQAKITRCEVVWPTLSSLASADPHAAKPAKVAVLLKNTGQTRFDAAGKVSITDLRSRTVFSAPLVSLRPCLFAGDSRLFEAALVRPLPAGQYLVQVECDYQRGWVRARARLPLEITSERAELLKAAQKQQGEPRPVQAVEHKLSVRIPPGAFRSLHLRLKNHGEDSVHCVAKLVGAGDRPVDASWVTIDPPRFAIGRAGARTVEVAVRVGKGTAPGLYTSTVLVEASGARGEKVQIRTPLEIDVQ